MADLERIGIDVGEKLPLEEAVSWAGGTAWASSTCSSTVAATYVHAVIDPARCLRDPRPLPSGRGYLRLGLHTSSAVNIAELAPLGEGEAVDAYLGGYVDAAEMLGAGWIVVHAGFHFQFDCAAAHGGRDWNGLRRVVDYAETKNVRILLENLNKEPADAEVHYLAHSGSRSGAGITPSKSSHQRSLCRSPPIMPTWCRRASRDFWTRCRSTLFRKDAAGTADCFRKWQGRTFVARPWRFRLRRLVLSLQKARGYRGHFTNAFGSLDDMLLARAEFARGCCEPRRRRAGACYAPIAEPPRVAVTPNGPTGRIPWRRSHTAALSAEFLAKSGNKRIGPSLRYAAAKFSRSPASRVHDPTGNPSAQRTAMFGQFNVRSK